MFGFFVNGEFKGFWSNRVNDIFFAATCKRMNWPLSLTTMVHYPEMVEVQIEHAEPSEKEVKINKEELIEDGKDDEGNPKFKKEKKLIKKIHADIFVKSGIVIKPC